MNAIELLAVGSASGAGLVLTTFGFGFRHGIDWDHIAALTDITGSQPDRRRSFWLATLYALGHSAVVFVLGVVVILFAARVPDSVDLVMERFVGVTLVLLGVYVMWALIRDRRNFRMRSRWMLLFALLARARRRLRRPAPDDGGVVEIEHDHAHDADEGHHHADDHAHAAHVHEYDRTLVTTGGPASAPASVHSHRHRHVASMPADPFASYGTATALSVGAIHGVGAETPTQVLIFLTAAGAGGPAVGVALLVCFLIGLLCSNTLIALAGTFGFLGSERNFKLYVAVSLVAAVMSLVVGLIFLTGQTSALPVFFSG